MKAISLWTSLWLLCFSGLASAEAVETKVSKCQKLAHGFAENPDTLNADQLQQLQFCVAQTLKQRYETNPPDQLKGTIMDLPSSTEIPPTAPSAPSPNQQ